VRAGERLLCRSGYAVAVLRNPFTAFPAGKEQLTTFSQLGGHAVHIRTSDNVLFEHAWPDLLVGCRCRRGGDEGKKHLFGGSLLLFEHVADVVWR